MNTGLGAWIARDVETTMKLAFLFCAIITLGGTAVIMACAAESDPSTDTPFPTAEAPTAVATMETVAPVPTAEDSTAVASTEAPESDGPDISLFFDGALAESVTTEPCTLSGGAEATCYRITVVGLPVDHAVGPFCPPTTSSTAAEGGIWFDGVGLYDLDGEFIKGLSSLYNDDNWLLYDEDGNVNVTATQEAFEGAARPNVAPQYQNHCVEGRIDWLPGGQPVTTTVLIPTSPVVADAPALNALPLGVMLNGTRIDGSAPVDAILRAYTIAAFDDCGGHFNPFEGYHVHASMGCSGIEVEDHGLHFAYALDGYPIFTVLPDDQTTTSDLDECGGHHSDALGYHYHAAPAAENSVLRCLTGEIVRRPRR